MREKSDLRCYTNNSGMHALLEGSQAVTGQLCLSCWSLCLELNNCSCTVSPLPWDPPVTFLSVTDTLESTAPFCSMLQCGSIKHRPLVGVLKDCISATEECSKCANVKLHKARAGSGGLNLVQVYLLIYTIHAYVNPPNFLLEIHNLQSLNQVGLFQKEIADSLWDKVSELINCHTNTAGSGPKTTLDSWLIWQC